MHVPPLEFTTADKALVELTASAVVCFVDAPGAAADETQRAVYRAAYGREAPVVNAAGEGTCAPAPFTPSLSLSLSLSLSPRLLPTPCSAAGGALPLGS
jgi:hypothetical protein